MDIEPEEEDKQLHRGYEHEEMRCPGEGQKEDIPPSVAAQRHNPRHGAGCGAKDNHGDVQDKEHKDLGALQSSLRGPHADRVQQGRQRTEQRARDTCRAYFP